MKAIVYIVSLLLISNSAFSQSKPLTQIKPKWKLGDTKRVQTASGSKIFIKDSLLNNTEVVGSYIIQVIDTVKNYTISYSNETSSMNMETKSSISNLDSVVNFVAGLVKKIEKETSAFKYELLVDKSTGQAFKVKNGDKYLKMVEKVASTMIDELGQKKGKTLGQIDSMKKRVVAYFRVAEPKILETTINQFNYLMQAYSYTFPLNSTISQKIMVNDVNALGEFGGIEMPAVLTISSRKQNNTLTIETDTDYDKDFLLVQLKKKRKDLTDITTSDIFLTEKVEVVISTPTGWMVSHKSNVVFKMKEVKVVNETTVNFQ